MTLGIVNEGLDHLPPLIQFVLAILLLAAGGVGIWRGVRARSPDPPSETRWFFDGPLGQALNSLRDSAQMLERNHETQKKISEQLTKLISVSTEAAGYLRDIRDGQIHARGWGRGGRGD